MSAQKLLAEAEKALEKGKETEAIEKFKKALAMEPTNQFAGTRLSAVYAELGKADLAGEVLKALGGRLAEAGKAHVAIAIYKQACEYLPRDIALKLKLASECESARKFNEALIFSQQALSYYLQRKRYFEAANVMPLLARLNEKDQNIKFMWFEVLRLSQAEQKVIHFLVNVFGPPGLSSSESSVGGDPKNISDKQFFTYKTLVELFPKDPKIPYSIAWAFYKREQYPETSLYLRECLRRDPDFTLAYVLFARLLADLKKVNEAYFVFKFGKERLPVDKSVDQLSLAKQIQQFEENNGWIKFIDGGLGEAPNLKSFLSAIRGAPVDDSEVMTKEELKRLDEFHETSSLKKDLPPEEIELNLSGEVVNNAMVIEHTSATQVVKSGHLIKPPTPGAESFSTKIVKPAMPPTSNASKPPLVPIVAMENNLSASSGGLDPVEMSKKENTKVVIIDDVVKPTAPPDFKMDFLLAVPEEKQKLIVETENIPPANSNEEAQEKNSSLNKFKSAESTMLTGIIRSGTESLSELASTVRVTADEIDSNVTMVKPATDENQATQVEMSSDPESPDSQEEFINEQSSVSAELPTRSVIAEKAKKLVFSVAAEKKESTKKIEHSEQEDRTILFSPMETINAANLSRKPLFQAVQKILPKPKEASIQTRLEDLSNQGDKTQILVNLPAQNSKETIEKEEGFQEKQFAKHEHQEASAKTEVQAPQQTDSLNQDEIEINQPAIGFAKIPEVNLSQQKESEEELPDLGEDLLEGATRILSVSKSIGQTEQLVREIAHNFKSHSEEKVEFEVINRNVDRLISKRKYYLARKVLRRFFGNHEIDQEAIKNKLREVRKLEIPDSMYSSMSSDSIERQSSESIIESLEEELFGDEIANQRASEDKFDESMYSEIYTSDPETQIDFGVGLIEMGLNLHAENIFQRILEEHPLHAFNCFYLIAISKSARKDFVGSISILKMLSLDVSKNEIEKLPVYYALAESLEKTKKYDDSQKYYKIVASVDANYRNTRERLKDSQ